MIQARNHHKPALTERRHERGLLFDLLAYAANDLPSHSANGIPAGRLEHIDDGQMQWVIDAGLAPLLYRAARAGIEQVPPVQRDLLLSADLTAMVRHRSLIDATNEIIDVCQESGAPLTLLKGISISDQYYPAAHLRPMGDIDILVSEPACERIESTMLRLGYRRKSDHEHREGAHHGAPLFHPERRVWVEIHNALFSQGTNLRSSGVFSPSHVTTQFVTSTFRGRAVNRLTDELQLVYIASFWVQDLSRYKIHASFMPPLLDALYLLKATKRTLDWDGLLGWLDNAMPAASLYLMLTYLSRRGLYRVDPPILSRLASSQDIVGPVEIRIVHGILHDYLIGGRPFSRLFSAWHAQIVLSTLLAPGSRARKLASLPWNLVFPPSMAERYSVRYQLGRIARMLRGKA